MTFTAFTRLSLSLGSLAIVLAAASPARAQACKNTTECPQGFVCEISQTPKPTDPGVPGTTSSAGATVPAADLIAPATGGYCQPAPCTKDSECGAGMLCHSQTRKECSWTAPTIACAPNSDCKLPAPTESCTETTVKTCAYKWQLPCNTDVECGAGFNCMPTVTGSCSGGGGTTPGAGSTEPATGAPADFRAPVPPDSMCTTTTSFPGYCQPKATTCTANTDCPTAWKCEAVATSRPSPGAPASDGGGNTSSSGAGVAPPPATDLPAPPPEATTKICQSPLGYGGTAGRDDLPVTDTKGDGTGGPPTSPAPSGGNAQGESADTSPKAGCSLAGNAGSGASFALVAFGLVGLALARRRRS